MTSLAKEKHTFLLLQPWKGAEQLLSMEQWENGSLPLDCKGIIWKKIRCSLVKTFELLLHKRFWDAKPSDLPDLWSLYKRKRQ